MDMTDLAKLQSRYDELTNELAAVTDNAKRIVLQKELARLLRIIDALKDLERLEKIIVETKEQLKQSSHDAEMSELFKVELHDLGLKKIEKERAIEDLMIPSDEHDERSVFIEIRAGAGGQEAALFAADLLRMYTNYAMKKGWRATVVDESFTDLGGIRDGHGIEREGGGNVDAAVLVDRRGVALRLGIDIVQRADLQQAACRRHDGVVANRSCIAD